MRWAFLALAIICILKDDRIGAAGLLACYVAIGCRDDILKAMKDRP